MQSVTIDFIFTTISYKVCLCNIINFEVCRDGRDLLKEMETFEENIGNVKFEMRTTSSSTEWFVPQPWHWRPKPRTLHFQTIDHCGYPLPILPDLLKSMLKVYNSLILPKDWLTVLKQAFTPIPHDPMETSSPDNMKRRTL